MSAIYYQRSDSELRALVDLQNEIHAITPLIKDAFTIAQEVANQTLARERAGHRSTVCFQVDRLFLQHILLINAAEISARIPGGGLSDKNFTQLRRFFDTADLSFARFDNPQRVEGNHQSTAAASKIAITLQSAYRVHTGRFIKQDIPHCLQGVIKQHFFCKFEIFFSQALSFLFFSVPGRPAPSYL